MRYTLPLFLILLTACNGKGAGFLQGSSAPEYAELRAELTTAVQKAAEVEKENPGAGYGALVQSLLVAGMTLTGLYGVRRASRSGDPPPVA